MLPAAPTPMTYREAPPPAKLAPWVAALWRFEVAPAAAEIEHRIPLTGGVLLSLGPGGRATLVGPRLTPLVSRVRGGDVFLGVHLRPGASGLLGVPAAVLRDALGPPQLWLDPAWCASWQPVLGAALTLEPLLVALGQRIPEAPPLDPVVMRAVRRIVDTQGAVPVGELAAAVELSPRQLRRRFVPAVGLGAKQLCRIRRARASAAEAVLSGRSWAEVMAERGFADQPHLVRELQSLLGVAPERFAAHARQIDHELVEP